MASKTLSATLHATGALGFAATYVWTLYVPNPLRNGFGGPFQFLTIISLTLSYATFAAGLLADLTRNRHLVACRAAFSLCATPLEVLVTLLYWGLAAYDRELLTPPEHKIPILLDLSLHALPAVLLVLDFMYLSPAWGTTALRSVAVDCSIAAAYLTWLEYCFSRNHWYPYPLLLVLSPEQKVLLTAVSALLMVASTTSLQWIHGRVHKQQQYGGWGKME